LEPREELGLQVPGGLGGTGGGAGQKKIATTKKQKFKKGGDVWGG